MNNIDYIHLIFSKFQISLPSNDLDTEFLGRQIGSFFSQTGIFPILENLQQKIKRLSKNKNINFEILKNEINEYEVKLSLKRYRQVIFSMNIRLKKCSNEIESFYIKDIKNKFCKFTKSIDNNYIFNEKENIKYLSIYKNSYCSDISEKNSFTINGKEFILTNTKSILSCETTAYYDYDYNFNLQLISYLFTKDNNKIYLKNDVKNKKYIPFNSSYNSTNDLSPQFADYLNQQNKNIEDITEDDYEMFKLVLY